MNNKKPLSIAFIGGGLSSAVGHVHYNASRLDGYWRLIAGAFSRNAEINRLTAKEWNVASEHLYSDWRDLIEAERSRIDAVALLTPTPHHGEVLCALIDANIPVICEKAMVDNLAEAEELLEMSRSKGHFLTVTFNYSAYPMVRELRERILRGELGKIQQIQLEMPQEGLVRPPQIAGKSAPPQSWRLNDKFIPTICLDLGVHLHHLAYFLTGEIEMSVNAEFKTFSNFGVVDDVMLWTRYASGTSASYWMTKTAIGNRNGLRVRLMGTDASAEWYQQEPEQLKLSSIDGSHCSIDRGGQAILAGEGRYNRMKVGHPSGFIEAFANLYADSAEAYWEWKKEGKFSSPYAFDASVAVDGLKLFHRAKESYQEQVWKEI